MPKFRITTNDSERVDRADEPIEFPHIKAATDDAQIALADMAREKLPDGKHAEFGVEIKNEEGKPVYRAILTFSAKEEEDLAREEQEAEAAALKIATRLRVGPRK